MVETNKISAGHARALLAVEDSVKQKELALLIIEKGLNVRDVESLIKNIDKVKQISLPKEKSLEIKDFEERIKRLLSTKAEIKGDEKKGKIIINYYSKEDLNRIYDILNK